jgi:hypothetical protein
LPVPPRLSVESDHIMSVPPCERFLAIAGK